MMSKIVFLGAPAHGHVNPTLPVAQELARRGEQVVYYNTEEFRQPIERTGASFYPYPHTEINSSALSIALQDGNLANIVPLLMSATELLLPYLLETLPPDEPDLVIFDSMALWGSMAATLLHLPTASTISHWVFDVNHLSGENTYSLRHLWQMLPKVPSALLARLRLSRRFKGAYPKARPLIPLRAGLNIVFTARELQPDTPIIDDTFRFVGPSIQPESRADDFPFDALQAGPIVYISLGTIHHGMTDFYLRCFEAFHNYPAQFILSIGTLTDEASLGTIPPNFIVRPVVPQLDVLQHAAIFITHGGANSIHEGLYYGVPLIVIPHQLEQLLNARRIEKQGAGLLLEDYLATQRVSASSLRQALDKVMSESPYAEAATRVQHILRRTGGYRQAADEIQTYLAQDARMASR
jgi:MGT family glycosyltransferase